MVSRWEDREENVFLFLDSIICTSIVQDSFVHGGLRNRGHFCTQHFILRSVMSNANLGVCFPLFPCPPTHESPQCLPTVLRIKPPACEVSLTLGPTHLRRRALHTHLFALFCAQGSLPITFAEYIFPHLPSGCHTILYSEPFPCYTLPWAR